MISEREISEEIARLEAAAVSFENCHRLATLYVIRDKIEARKPAGSARQNIQYELSNEEAAEKSSAKEHIYVPKTDTEFLQAVKGKDPEIVWAVMDELMGTIKIINPRLYDGVLRRLEK